MLDEWDLAAWSIAWEGSIWISTWKDERGYKILKPCVSIGNQDKSLLEKFQVLVGEIGHITNIPGKNGCWDWRVTKQTEILFFCEKIKDIMPFERKKRIVKLMIEFCKLRQIERKYSERAWQIFCEIRILNKSGEKRRKNLWLRLRKVCKCQ